MQTTIMDKAARMWVYVNDGNYYYFKDVFNFNCHLYNRENSEAHNKGTAGKTKMQQSLLWASSCWNSQMELVKENNNQTYTRVF